MISRALPLLTCSVGWNGSAGSGFAGSPPVDPVRITAKPACRLLVPPNQYFTNTLEVGVIAFANDGGTLIGGIDRVRFHFEGRSVDVIEPRWHTIETAVGPRRYFGYWVRLQKPSGMSGHAHLYIEAIPADATMQSRVIGPFQFSPQPQLYDAELTVTPSQPVVAGQNYHTVGAAMAYHHAQQLNNTLITVTEPLTEDLTVTAPALSPPRVGQGYCIVQATAPVTFARPEQGLQVESQFRNRINRLCFRGRNITFDMRHISAVWSEETLPGHHWLDGCRIVNSAGRGHLWLAGNRPYGHLVRGTPYFTEVEFNGVPDAADQAMLVRGCEAFQTYRDFAGDARCVVGNQLVDHDSISDWLVDVPALEVTYTGEESTATLRRQSGQNSLQTITATWGASSATFQVRNSEAFYLTAINPSYNAATAGQGYFVQNLADWINSLPGWSATVLDNTRGAWTLGLAGTRGLAYSAQNVRNTVLQLVTCFDAHGDFYQQRSGGLTENCIIAFNRGIQMRGQNIFLSATPGPCNDYMVVGNAFSNTPSTAADGPYGIFTNTSSQFDRSPHNHVVFVHNTMPTQGLRLRADNSAYSNDSYGLIANNAMLEIRFSGTPLPQHLNAAIRNNVIDEGFPAPQGSNGTISAGNYLTKHVNSVAGNFTPAGQLLMATFEPVVLMDVPAEAMMAARPAGVG
ncbi:MAG: hypothetical protein ACK4IS_11120 [Erythrobacter sp.]